MTEGELKRVKLRIKFKDGLETWIDYECPKGAYLPYEFTIGRPDRIENVTVRSNPVRTRFPLYVEASDE